MPSLSDNYILTVKAPGRANIIGEHIDYCGATVLPFAIAESLYLHSSPNDKNIWKIEALDIHESLIIDLIMIDDIGITHTSPVQSWSRFFFGVIHCLRNKGLQFGGLDIAFESNIPIGAGMSSSSALTCAIIKSVDKHFDLKLSPLDIVNLASEAENGTGINGGKMDQYTIVHAMPAQILQFDCAQMEHKFIPLDFKNHSFFLLQSGVQHELVNSPYNQRRQDIADGLAWIQSQLDPDKTYLNLSINDLKLLQAQLPISAKRLKHTITEIARVDAAIQAIVHQDVTTLGRLLTETHYSLRDQYDVSCEEIDFLVNRLLQYPAVLGARIMGGGFGGSIILLADKHLSIQNLSSLRQSYKSQYGIEIELLRIHPEQGMH